MIVRMSVMVTGASGLIGRALVPALAATNLEVRCAVRGPERAEELRALGGKVTVGRLDESADLAEVLGGVDTLIHLVGGLDHPDEDALQWANHGSTLVALHAAADAAVRRFMLVSAPGAGVDATHPYLRAKGLAEEAVAAAGLEHLILRCAHAYGLGGLWFTGLVHGVTASPPLVIGEGDQEIAPVLADDVAAVLAAADARPEALVGTYGLEGEDVVTADGLLELLSGAGVEAEHLAGDAAAARLTTLLGIPVMRAAADLFAMPSRADAPDAAGILGVERTPLVEGLRRTLARASGKPAG
jgi:NADH dehydrogenase